MNGVELIGPFRDGLYRITVDGYELPYVSAEDAGAIWYFHVDNRMAIEASSRREVENWAYIVGRAMAVAAGYPCVGAKEKMHPFARKLIGVADVIEETKSPGKAERPS